MALCVGLSLGLAVNECHVCVCVVNTHASVSLICQSVFIFLINACLLCCMWTDGWTVCSCAVETCVCVCVSL